MPADRLPAGKSADGLVDYCLENGGGQVLLGGAVVDQRLDVRFGKHPASGGNGIKQMVIFGIFVDAAGVRLQKGCHLINKGACAACADAVHALLYVAALEVNDLGILAA